MKVIFEFILLNFKALKRCRINFCIDIVIALFKQILFLLSWKTFFDCYSTVGSWHYTDMLCMYGLISISIGFVEMFFGGIKDLSFFIEFDKLESLILYPSSQIINIGTSNGSLSSLGDIFVGIFCIFSSYISIKSLLLIIFLIPLNIVFMFSLQIYINSLGFFISNSLFLRDFNSKVMIFLTQPASGYKGILKIVSFSIIPVALGNFMPIKFLKNPTIKSGTILVFSVMIFFVLSIFFFNYGIKRFKKNN